MSLLSKSFASAAAGVCLAGVAVPSAAVAETIDRPASAEELTILAAALEQGALGSGDCPWWHQMANMPTSIPCEVIPLPLLANMAKNPANKRAQLELGKRYEEGRGLTQDFSKARKYYRMAARDLTRGRPILLPGRDPSPLSFGEVGHGGTLIETGFNRPRTPGYVSAVGLPEARVLLKGLPD